MQSPDVHLVVCVQYTLTLQEVEEIIVHICKTTPQVSPGSLNVLVVHAPSSESAASSRASEKIHEQTHLIVFSPMICPDPRKYAIFCHSIHEAVENSAAAIVVGSTQNHNEVAIAIYSSMDDYPPPKSEEKNRLLQKATLIIYDII